MVFFGFTQCPEICPTTLNDISIWLDEINARAEKIWVSFVPVTPERDIAEELNKYLKNFASQIVGVTGTQVELEKLFNDFGVYAQKVTLDESSYAVNHSSSVYFIKENNTLFDIISFGESSENVIKKVL